MEKTNNQVGNNEQGDKFYKKWWFILISIVLFIVLILSITLPFVFVGGESGSKWNVPLPYNEEASYTSKTNLGHVEYEDEAFLHHNDKETYPENEIDYVLGAFNTFAFMPFLADIFWGLGGYRSPEPADNYFSIIEMYMYQGERSEVSFDYEFFIYLEDESGTKLETIDKINEAEKISIFLNFSNIDIFEEWYTEQEDLEDSKFPIEFDIWADYFVVELDYFVSKNILLFDFVSTNFEYVETGVWGWGEKFSDVDNNFDSWTLIYDFDENEFIIYGMHRFVAKDYDGYSSEEDEYDWINKPYMYGFDSREFDDNSVVFDYENYDDYWYEKDLYDKYYDGYHWVYDYQSFGPNEEWIWMFDLNDDYVHFII